MKRVAYLLVQMFLQKVKWIKKDQPTILVFPHPQITIGFILISWEPHFIKKRDICALV